MPFADLQHEGGEDFDENNEVKDRKDQKKEEAREKLASLTKDEKKELLQELWMNPNNELLWEELG